MGYFSVTAKETIQSNSDKIIEKQAELIELIQREDYIANKDKQVSNLEFEIFWLKEGKELNNLQNKE